MLSQTSLCGSSICSDSFDSKRCACKRFSVPGCVCSTVHAFGRAPMRANSAARSESLLTSCASCAGTRMLLVSGVRPSDVCPEGMMPWRNSSPRPQPVPACVSPSCSGPTWAGPACPGPACAGLVPLKGVSPFRLPPGATPSCLLSEFAPLKESPWLGFHPFRSAPALTPATSASGVCSSQLCTTCPGSLPVLCDAGIVWSASLSVACSWLQPRVRFSHLVPSGLGQGPVHEQSPA